MKRLSRPQWLALHLLAGGTGYHLRWWEGRHYAVHAPSGVRVHPDRFGQATVDRLVTLGLLEAKHLADGTLLLHPTADAWNDAAWMARQDVLFMDIDPEWSALMDAMRQAVKEVQS